MSVSDFELNITSRLAAAESANPAASRDAGSGAPSRLVWQPTFTLWQPGESTAIVLNPSAGKGGATTASSPSVPLAHSLHETTAARMPAPLARRSQSLIQREPAAHDKSYWQRLWQGDISLAQTFSAYVIFFFALIAALSRLPWEELTSFTVLFAGVFAALVVLHLAGILAFVRAVWRATSKYSSASGPALWCGVARGASLVMLIAGLHLGVLVCTPRLVEIANIASGVVPTGNHQLRLARSGTELEINGAIGIGLTKKVSQVLDLNRRIQSVQLNSEGGSARESRRLRDLIAQRKLSTSTARGCYGECTLAYVAGQQRRIGARASLRFYRSDLPGMPEWALWRDYERDRRDWLARGVAVDFVDQALTARDRAAWQPSLSELIAANIVSPSVDVAETLSARGGEETLALLDRELRRAPFFALLKDQEPEGYRKLVGDIHAGLQSSVSAEDFQLRIHPMAKAVSYHRLSQAEDALLLEYAGVILEQISLLYSDNAAICNRYFGMDLSGAALDTTKFFAEEMLAKETDLMAEVLRSSATQEYRPPAKPTIQARWNAILTLIGKRYGGKAALLFESRQGKRDAGQTCHVLYEFYRAVTRLPAQEAGPLLRYHFAQLRARSLPPTPLASAAKAVASKSAPAANRRLEH